MTQSPASPGVGWPRLSLPVASCITGIRSNRIRCDYVPKPAEPPLWGTVPGEYNNYPHNLLPVLLGWLSAKLFLHTRLSSLQFCPALSSGSREATKGLRCRPNYELEEEYNLAKVMTRSSTVLLRSALLSLL